MASVASVEQRDRRGKASLDPLTELLRADLERVNRLIVERMHSPVALIPQLAGHIVAGGGKRLRPMLTLGAARLCGYRGGRHVALAAAVEFIHTATLLHDDVVDSSDLRRGRDTANAVWGNKPAVLV
ncbi:MAG TPA: polyprenyl synthetase family protein, partial [Stellaceae bacterium]|nr:polyprenyl synthetase family protein [Stellaceae bacterium]